MLERVLLLTPSCVCLLHLLLRETAVLQKHVTQLAVSAQHAAATQSSSCCTLLLCTINRGPGCMESCCSQVNGTTTMQLCIN
jgi:hypothetical protein